MCQRAFYWCDYIICIGGKWGATKERHFDSLFTVLSVVNVIFNLVQVISRPQLVKESSIVGNISSGSTIVKLQPTFLFFSQDHRSPEWNPHQRERKTSGEDSRNASSQPILGSTWNGKWSPEEFPAGSISSHYGKQGKKSPDQWGDDHVCSVQERAACSHNFSFTQA